MMHPSFGGGDGHASVMLTSGGQASEGFPTKRNYSGLREMEARGNKTEDA